MKSENVVCEYDFGWGNFRYVRVVPKRFKLWAAVSVMPACEKRASFEPCHLPSLPQCPYHESGGARCEAESGHQGPHDFTDALFWFGQHRWGLQGPICLTRRGPAMYVYEEGPMQL